MQPARTPLTHGPASPPGELNVRTGRVLSREPLQPLVKRMGKLAQSHTTNLPQEQAYPQLLLPPWACFFAMYKKHIATLVTLLFGTAWIFKDCPCGTQRPARSNRKSRQQQEGSKQRTQLPDYLSPTLANPGLLPPHMTRPHEEPTPTLLPRRHMSSREYPNQNLDLVLES